MFRKLLLLLIFTLASFGCEADVPDSYYFGNPENKIKLEEPKYVFSVILDSRFTKEQMLSLKTALVDWSTQLNDNLHFSINIADLSKDNKDLQAGTIKIYRELPPKGLGFTVWNFPRHSAVIWMNIDIDEKSYYPIALHEIGHSIGLSHYEGSYESIMHPTLSLGRKIACSDVAATYELWKWEEDFKCILKTPHSESND